MKTDDDTADFASPKPRSAKPKKGAEELPVAEHARALGHVRKGGGTEPAEFFSPEHAGAAALHGWNAHAHHAGEPMKLTREHYKAALDAVPNARPHLPALSPHVGK